MQVTEAAKSRIIDIADQAERSDFSGLRQIATKLAPDVLIPVDPPDLLGTRLDAFITDGNLYLQRGENIYAVGALSSLPELSGISVFENAQPNEPHFVAGGSSTRSSGKTVLPHGATLGAVLDVAATLQGAAKTGELPAEWLVAATKALHNTEFNDGYYDYRVAVHGAAAEQLLTDGGLPTIDSGSELLLLDVYGYDEINAQVYALDVASGSMRRLGYLDDSDFVEATEWDGNAAPERLANGVLLPTGSDRWDSGDQLAGFDEIARFTPPTPLDFEAILEMPPSRMPALGAVGSALESNPVANIYALSTAGSALSIVSAEAAYSIVPGSGQFVGAGWTTDVAIEEALAGMAHPRLGIEAWREADDGLSASRFGLAQARPLLWLEEADGTQHVLAFSGNTEKPHVLELCNPPLAVRTHTPAG